MKIVIDSKILLGAEAFGRLGEVVQLDTKQIDGAAIRGADMLVVRSETRVDRSLLHGSGVQFVGTATIGVDHVDTEYLDRAGIAFASAPGSNANSVAEYVVTALLVLSQRLGIPLAGRTLGVVGVGNIGSRMVRYGTALGMEILQNDPPLARQTGESRFRRLEEVLDADIVTLHVPLTSSGEDPTFHLFDEERIGSMKPRSILINTSRGGVVDTHAALRALKRGTLRTCILDVWESEPSIDGELLSRTAVGTPHIAGYSLDGKLNGTRMIYEAACRHVGAVPYWDERLASLLPALAPRVVQPDVTCIEGLLMQAVLGCYDIERDDKRLREMLSLPTEQRAGYFTQLRATYPPRREFHALTLLARGVSAADRDTLGTLGFKVASV